MLILLLLTTQVKAADYVPLQGNKYRWTLGFDVDYQIIHPTNDFNYLTHNTRVGGQLYVAYRTRGIWGFEAGYNWTNDKPMNISVVPGTTLFGTTSTVSGSYQSKLRVEDTYLDLYGHWPIKKIAEIKYGVGIGFVRQDLTFRNINTLNPDPLQQTLLNLTTSTSVSARFNLGIQTMLGKQLGARALFSYQTTSNIRIHNAPYGVDTRMFNNSYTVFLGFFYNVTGYYD